MKGKRIGTILISALILVAAFGLPARSSIYAATNAFSLDVTYDSNIKCGQEVTFQLKVSNGSGQYKYLLNAVNQYDYDDKQYQMIIDPSRQKYGTSDTYKFTFYASGTYEVRFYVMDTGGLSIQTARKILYINIDDDKYPTVEASADSVATQCIDAGCKTDFEKAAWLHDWVLDHITYDYSYTYCGAEGVFARGKGTCEAYHRALEKLFRRVGLETERMEGNGHVWTGVKLDGKWYHIDATWNDNGNYGKDNYERYLYWGVTDEQIATAHNEHKAHSGKECTSLEDNYFIKTGWVTQWSDKYKADIQAGLDEGKSSGTIECKEKTIPNVYWSIMMPIIAYQLSTEEWTLDEGIFFNSIWENGKIQYYACRIGDSNKDGKLSAADLTTIAKHCAQISTIRDDYTLMLCNTNKVNGVEISDATHLARYLARIIKTL